MKSGFAYRSPCFIALAALLPGGVLAQPQPWPALNRYVELHVGQHRQDYREIDTQGLTRNGVLDSESGVQSQAGAAARWQTEGGWLVHLQVQRQSGPTAYNGYLQSGGGSLTPYRAHTGNTATQVSLDLGYALNASHWSAVPANWQITPLIQFGQHRWERNLVQYSETYDYSAHAVGVLVQWQAKAGTVLELHALVGHTQSASVNVPVFGFATEQPGGSFREWQLGINQDLAILSGKKTFAGWRLAARYTASQYGHGESPVIKGLQAPPNQHTPSTWTLGLQKQF